MNKSDNDIELLAGQVWNAPERPSMMVIESTPGGCERPAWAERFLAAKEAHDQELEAARLWMGGAQWSEEEIAALKAELRATPTRNRFELARICLMPQAEIVRRAPLPEESENDHLPPHYSDLIDKKGSA